MNEIKNEIPKQKVGNKHSVVSCKSYGLREEVLNRLIEVKSKFYDINNWHNFINGPATFKHINCQLVQTYDQPRIGNYIGVKLGLHNTEGEGYDWVQVVDIKLKKALHYYSFTVKPVSNPFSAKDQVAHFYRPSASNTFILRLEHNTIYAEVHGRNEVINTRVPLINSVRNKIVGLGGILGLGKVQWKDLTDNLLNY